MGLVVYRHIALHELFSDGHHTRISNRNAAELNLLIRLGWVERTKDLHIFALTGLGVAVRNMPEDNLDEMRLPNLPCGFTLK